MWHWVDDTKNPSRVQVCAGQGGGKVAFLRNDQVSVTDCVPLKEKIKTTRPKHDWISIATRFDIIVLSKGAHVVDDEGTFRRETEETARWVKKFVSGKPGRQVRSSVPVLCCAVLCCEVHVEYCIVDSK
jgi:hypothetical protein